jgi:hypothetical protein
LCQLREDVQSGSQEAGRSSLWSDQPAFGRVRLRTR